MREKKWIYLFSKDNKKLWALLLFFCIISVQIDSNIITAITAILYERNTIFFSDYGKKQEGGIYSCMVELDDDNDDEENLVTVWNNSGLMTTTKYKVNNRDI